MFKKEKDLSPWNDWYSLCDYEFHHKGKIIEGNNNWKPQIGTKFYSFTWDGKVFENIFIGSDVIFCNINDISPSLSEFP